MRARGINYDTGFLSAGTTTHEPFDPDVVRREMRIIRDDLHCTAVRITGGDAARLKIAATHAAGAGLEVWLCPFVNGVSEEALLAILADCAEHAERLRREGAQVVVLTGSELSLFLLGVLPGDTLDERLALLGDPMRLRSLVGEARARLDDFLRRAVEVVRARFGGPVSYASLPLDGVDWTRFDIIATDAGYRTAVTEPRFAELIRTFVEQGRTLGKPVAVTEFGCGAYRGASANAGRGDQILTWDAGARPVRIEGDFVRDEEEQATYVREVLEVLDAEGVDAGFVYTFARWDLPYRPGPREDFDMASYGIVKVLDDRSGVRALRYPDMRWEPKRAFDVVAEVYGGNSVIQ